MCQWTFHPTNPARRLRLPLCERSKEKLAQGIAHHLWIGGRTFVKYHDHWLDYGGWQKLTILKSSIQSRVGAKFRV